MIRTILSIITGLLTGIILIGLIEKLTHSFYPFPQNINLNDPEIIKRQILNLPFGAFMLLILAYITGSLGAGFAAGLVARVGVVRNALIVGILLTMGGITNLIMIPHPQWFWCSLLVYVPMAYTGARTALNIKPKPPMQSI